MSSTDDDEPSAPTVAELNEQYQNDDTDDACSWSPEEDDEEIVAGEWPLTGEGTLGYDDIQIGMRVIFRDKEGYVVDKGDHLRDTDNEHIEVTFPKSNRRNKTLHENVVDRWLEKRKRLWVDWTGMGVNSDA